MYTKSALIAMHRQSHEILAQLIDHCRSFKEAELKREFEGFGFPSLQLQLHHVIGAERYWIGVLDGRIDAEDDEESFPTTGDLAEFRAAIAANSQTFLADTTDAYLNESRGVITWDGQEKTVIPARVILRVLMHNFHHQGQMAALCRLLGRPVAGLDFPTA